jgi:hypothetical protein
MSAAQGPAASLVMHNGARKRHYAVFSLGIRKVGRVSGDAQFY